jgi:hypothetical protein
LARFLGEKVKLVAVALLLFLVIGGVSALYMLSTVTTVEMTPAVKTIGVSTPVTFLLTNPHGVRSTSVYLEQNGVRRQIAAGWVPARRFLWARHVPPATIAIKTIKDLKEGPARLIVEAVSNDFRAATTTASCDVNVILAPPRVTPDGLQHYVNQGGMELVTFTTGGSWTEAGVKVKDATFRSFPMPGGDPSHRFAMFAYPWDLDPGIVPMVFARNAAGAEAAAPFWFKLFPKKFRARDFPIDDALMQKLVNSVDPTGAIAPGKDLLTRFLYINGDLRRQNNRTLADLRFKTEEKILWHGPFIHWGKEEADFADVRNYIYHGQKVDQQVHLGFDLSDTENSPVQAANDGRVVWAADLGIYGNCIVVDHGYALQSIYGHLREIDVKVGDMVAKGQKMGIAGQTGLAGGVHVHFSMQIDGVQINPREWWDEHWIKDRILSKLTPAAP